MTQRQIIIDLAKLWFEGKLVGLSEEIQYLGMEAHRSLFRSADK